MGVMCIWGVGPKSYHFTHSMFGWWGANMGGEFVGQIYLSNLRLFIEFNNGGPMDMSGGRSLS